VCGPDDRDGVHYRRLLELFAVAVGTDDAGLEPERRSERNVATQRHQPSSRVRDDLPDSERDAVIAADFSAFVSTRVGLGKTEIPASTFRAPIKNNPK
jgi:hypothetical protein